MNKLIVTLFLALTSQIIIGQTTIFLFNNGTSPATDNAVGTPSASTNVTPGPFAGGCTGNNVFGFNQQWGIGEYFEFDVNPTGYNNMIFSYNELSSNIQIGNFIVRVSANGINWTTIRSAYGPPTGSCSGSGNLSIPASFNDQTTLIIQIYKSDNSPGTRSFRVDDVTLTGTLTSLPIELADFNADLHHGFPNITWSTYAELNNDHFTILRSKNGTNFQEIGHIVGNGNTDKKNDYSYLDQSPLSGKVFYQLKQTDFNGQFTFSLIRSIVVANNSQQPIVYPSLVDNEINIDFSNTKPSIWSWTLVNMQGQLIKKGVVKNPEDLVSVSSDMAPSGVVILTLISETGMYNYRLVKN